MRLRSRVLVVSCAAILAPLAGPLEAVAAQPATTKQLRGATAYSVLPRPRVYRSKYGFEIKYPDALELTAEGPDPYELELRAGRAISGTQAPLLDQVVLRDRAKKIVLEIEVPHDSLVDASNQWLWRPCGQDGFMRIESKAKMRLAGLRAIHVVSVGETEEDLNQRVHFVCVNGPRPLIFTYADEMRKRAEAIIATVRFAR